MTLGYVSSVVPGKFLSMIAVAVFATAASSHAQDKPKVDKGAAKEGLDHLKEELGVNQFTTPSIGTVLAALKELRPLAFDKVSRDLPDSIPADRARLALNTGALIADGFLAVTAEKQSHLDDIGRLLIRHAKGLGVGDHITRHNKSILEKAATKDWDGIRAELVSTQRDVERAMMALKDEEIAHLVALGGWARGLEISATLVAEHYTPERAAILVQASVLDYFIDRVSTLNPSLKKTQLFTLTAANLAAIRTLAIKDGGAPPSAEELLKIRNLAGSIIKTIGTPEE